MSKLLARLFLYLAEACDPSLQADRLAYEIEKEQLLGDIEAARRAGATMARYASEIERERNDATQQVEVLKKAIAAISEQLGTDRTAGQSDADVLRADLFRAGTRTAS